MFGSCFCRRGCQTNCDGYIRVLHVFLQGRAIVSCELRRFCHLQKSFCLLCLPTRGCMFFFRKDRFICCAEFDLEMCVFRSLRCSFEEVFQNAVGPSQFCAMVCPVCFCTALFRMNCVFSTVFGVGLFATSWSLDLSFARYLQHFAVRTSNGNGNCVMMESGFCACIVSTPCLALTCFTRMELARFRIMAGKFLQSCVFKIAPKKHD